MGCSGSKDLANRSAQAGAPPEVMGASAEDLDLHMKSGPRFEEQYQLGKELGHGSFSTVREGTQKDNGQLFAVKCVKRADLPPEDEADLKMEVQLLQEINHENIVKLYDFFEEKHFYFLVMEILGGGELFDRIVVKQFYSEKEARDVLVSILRAVQYCHDMNVVHRDLKPENLLLVSESDDASLKIADFGFARRVDPEGLSTQCGTPGYVAPEILKGEKYGKSVDMWSVGVIMYILLGGYPPFHDDNQAKLYQKIKKGKVTFHPQYWSTVSDEAKELIQRLLTLDKVKRITATDALKHPWIVGDASELERHDLRNNMDQFRLFNARRKFKSAISSVIAAQRMSSLVSDMERQDFSKPVAAAPDPHSATTDGSTAPPPTGEAEGAPQPIPSAIQE